jgi:predicted NAD/FAD-binding protein
MAFPIITLIRFWVNHHLLDIIERPLWRVVKGRSKAYVVRGIFGNFGNFTKKSEYILKQPPA